MFLTFELAKKFSETTFVALFSLIFLHFIDPFSFEKFHNSFFSFKFFLFPFEPQLPLLWFCRCFVIFIVLKQNGCNTDDRHDLFGFQADFGSWELDCIVVFTFTFIVFLFRANILFFWGPTEPVFSVVTKILFFFIFKYLRLADCMKSCWLRVIFIFDVVIFQGAFFLIQYFGTIGPKNIWFGFTLVCFTWFNV